jgi:preprotein translocase subunit YajC
MIPDDEFTRRRKSRSVVTAVILVGMVVLFYFITIARISGG